MCKDFVLQRLLKKPLDFIVVGIKQQDFDLEHKNLMQGID